MMSKGGGPILKTIAGSLIVLSILFTAPRISYAQQYEEAKYDFILQRGDRDRHANQSYDAIDTKTVGQTFPSKIALNDTRSLIKQLPANEKYECSIVRLLRHTRPRLILALESKPTQMSFRMKVACERPSKENKVYAEIVSSAVGEFFGARSYPLAHGMVLNVNQLTPDSTFPSNRAMYRCIWNMNGSSILAGAVTPYLPGLRKFEECEDLLSDKYGVALQWLLDLLAGNGDRRCEINSFSDENTGFWQSLDNDHLATSRPGFCTGTLFPELEKPFFMPYKRLPSTKAVAHVRKFCDIANVTMSILHRGLKGGNRDVDALEEYIIRKVTEDDLIAKFVPLHFNRDEKISKSIEGIKEIFRRGLNSRDLRDECIPAVDTLPSTIPSVIAHVFARILSVRSSALVPKLRTMIDKLCV